MKKLLRLSMMALVVASLFTVTGCRTKSYGDGASIGEEGWGTGDTPMSLDDFTKYPRVNQYFTPVYFAYDNYQIPSSEYGKIDSVVRFLQGDSSIVLIVEGHCDERGTIEYNLSLGDYRAQSVRTYMSNAGISSDRIQTTSFGKERPAVQGSGESVWSQNRRGEFALYRRGK